MWTPCSFKSVTRVSRRPSGSARTIWTFNMRWLDSGSRWWMTAMIFPPTSEIGLRAATSCPGESFISSFMETCTCTTLFNKNGASHQEKLVLSCLHWRSGLEFPEFVIHFFEEIAVSIDKQRRLLSFLNHKGGRTPQFHSFLA